jgi:hypothetical protein
MGPLAQNPSQSAAWPKPACDWATFGKFGGSGRPSVEIALRWPENRVLKSESDSTHGGHTHPLTEPQSHGDPKIQSLRPSTAACVRRPACLGGRAAAPPMSSSKPLCAVACVAAAAVVSVAAGGDESLSPLDAAVGHAAARPRLSLDGLWDFRCDNGSTGQIAVPQWWDAPQAGGWGCLSATYSRTVTVPADDPRWQPSLNRSLGLRLRFASVDQVATVFIDGVQCAHHMGGGLAFTVSVPPRSSPPSAVSFQLRVEVRGGVLPPITPASRDGLKCSSRDRASCSGPPNDRNNCSWDGEIDGGFCAGVPAWPVGWYGQQQRWGIGDSVTLQAVGKSVTLATQCFARASLTKASSLLVNCTLHNELEVAASVRLQLKASPHQPSPPLPDHASPAPAPPPPPRGALFSQQGVVAPPWSLPPGASREVQIEVDWADGEKWFPDKPVLYDLAVWVHLVDREDGGVAFAATVVDSDAVVVGFKRVEVRGTTLLLNGQRLNLRGTSIHPSQDFRTIWGAGGLIPMVQHVVSAWQQLGVNVLRVHQGPAPEAFLTACDERGLMIIEESAIYARSYVIFSPVHELYMRNSLAWVRQWVRQRRQHPSIVAWSAENENGCAFRECLTSGACYSALSDGEIALLAATVHEHDDSRPVGCDGDQIGSADHLPGAPGYTITSYHYPEGYGKSWQATERTIYLELKTKGRPNSVGEFMTDYSSSGGTDNKLWHGLVVRGLRYTGWSDIRPYTLAWALSYPSSTPVAPVSLGADLAAAAETL